MSIGLLSAGDYQTDATDINSFMDIPISYIYYMRKLLTRMEYFVIFR